ncbi:MAG: DUF4430 domain-containing protein [Symploca sp. SIO2E9]|nr:DUF4430 domain-containing protein [Symploca sp. SIO2E9]
MKHWKPHNVIFAALVCFLAFNLFLQPSAEAKGLTNAQADKLCIPGTVSITVSLDGDDIYNIPKVAWIENETVSLAMKNAKCADATFTYDTDTSCPFGDLVTTIGGNFPGKGKFWQLSINGTPSMNGIDTAILEECDEITWTNEVIPPHKGDKKISAHVPESIEGQNMESTSGFCICAGPDGFVCVLKENNCNDGYLPLCTNTKPPLCGCKCIKH